MNRPLSDIRLSSDASASLDNQATEANKDTHIENEVAPLATVREVQPDDAEAVYALLSDCFSDFPTDQQRWLACWRWQYWENPYRQGRPAGWVLADNDRILGHLGAVYVPLLANGEPVTGAICADYAVTDAAIVQGGMLAGLNLAQAFFAGIDDCAPLATTANEKTGAIFARFGCRPVPWTREFWRAPAALHQLIRSCGSARSRLVRWGLSGITGSVILRLAAVCYRWLHHCPEIPIPTGCWLETTVPQLACNLNRLQKWVSASEQSNASNALIKWRVSASQTYLNWRYVQHPQRDQIRVLVVRDADGEAIGAAFVFCDKSGGRHIAYVEELMALPNRPDVVRTLLCSAAKLAYDHQADYLVTMTGRRSIRHVYWELGFESRARSAPAAVIHASVLPKTDDDLIEFWHGVMF